LNKIQHLGNVFPLCFTWWFLDFSVFMKDDIWWYWMKLCILRQLFTKIKIEYMSTMHDFKYKSNMSYIIPNFYVFSLHNPWQSVSVFKLRTLSYAKTWGIEGSSFSRNPEIWHALNVAVVIFIIFHIFLPS
jgi:hypothetical protein